MARNKVIIAGVGRSGTSFLFQEFAAALNALGPSGFHYEPYLWAPSKVNETGRIETEPFDTRNLSPFGIYVHCESPLFLTGSHPVHDQMIERILSGDRHVMAKMIRGNGRIQAYLRADPELKVVGVLRDVFGTINSVSNHFSFFGEEFHPTDRPRFRQEVQNVFGDSLSVSAEDEVTQQAVWSAYWWKYQTLALFRAKEAFPDRVCLIDYDSLRVEPDRAYGAMEALTGLSLRAHRLKKTVGIVSGANYLSDVPLSTFAPFQTWSRSELESNLYGVVLSPGSISLAEPEDIAKRFSLEKPAVVSRYPLFRTAVGWRYAQQQLEAEKAEIDALHERAFRQHRASAVRRAEEGLAGPAVVPAAEAAQVSVVMPLWSAKDTVEEAVASVWAQVGVRVEVVLVDDASTDDTADFAEALLEKGPGRLIRNSRNLGPGLSRHKGVLAAAAPLISTLDADDYMFPLKLAREVEALADTPMAVAYSQVEYVRFGQPALWSYEDLDGLDKFGLVGSIAGRRHRIPRDMTFSRALYDRTRGFDGLLRMYEDWAFKIELAGVAARWINTGDLGMRYEHAATGASAAGPGKHVFFLHAAFLKNADMLALQLQGDALHCLEHAIEPFGPSPAVREGLQHLHERAAFSGNLLADLNAMRAALHRMIFRDDLSFDERLRRAYAAIGQDGPRAGAERDR